MFSVTMAKISEFEFCSRWISSSFANDGIQLAHCTYHGTHSVDSEFCRLTNHVIRDWNNWVHQLKKNGIRMINPAKTKNVAMRYVISIQIHLLMVLILF